MRELQLSGLRDPNLFQEFCEQLLSLEYPDFRSINSTSGDNGCDGLARNDELWFQCYYPEPASYPVIMERMKRKIATDLAKLEPPYPKEWIFITVEDASFGIHQYCRKKEENYEGMRILIWSESKIQSLLDKYQPLKNKWINRIYGEEIRVVQPEGVTYSERNNIPNLLELNKKFGASLSGWKHGDILKQVHTYDSTGKAKISFMPIDPTANLEAVLNVTFRFDNTPEGDIKLNEFLNSHKYGREFEVDQRYIEKASLNINNRELTDLFPPVGGIARMKISPVPLPPFDAHIDLYSNRNTHLQRIAKLKMVRTQISNEVFQFDNYSQEAEGIKIKFLINTVTREIDFNVRIDDKSADAIDGYRYAEMLKNFALSRKVNLDLHALPKPIEFIRKAKMQDELSITLKYSKMLQEIQDRIGEKIPSFFSKPITNEDIESIFYVYEIIKSGFVEKGRGGSFSTTLSDIPSAPLSNLLSEDGISLKFTIENIVVSLLGKEIYLGQSITYFDGVIDDASRTLLQNGIQNGNVEGINIVVVSREEEQPVVEIFPTWIKNADKKIKEFEGKRAQETRKMLLRNNDN